MFAAAVASLAGVEEPARGIEAAMIAGSELDLEEVERALRVRAPALELVRRGSDLSSRAGLRAYIDLRRTTPTQVDVSLILSDGRGYYRRVETGNDPPVRPVAGALAQLIAAIEDDSVAPDERGVQVPPELTAPVPPPPVQEKVCPAVPTCPSVAPSPPPSPPPLELAPTLRAGGTFGLGRGPRSRGASFGLGLDLRWRSGAMVAADLQVTASSVEGQGLARVRGSAGAGFGLRRGAFELPIVGMFGVEWWGVRGEQVLLVARGAGEGGAPMIGGGLRVAPAVRARLGPTALRVGLRVELWGSGEPGRGGLRRPVIARPGGAPLTSVGGAELSIALELALWIVGRR